MLVLTALFALEILAGHSVCPGAKTCVAVTSKYLMGSLCNVLSIIMHMSVHNSLFSLRLSRPPSKSDGLCNAHGALDNYYL